MSKEIALIKDKVNEFITDRKDFIEAFKLDLDTERITTTAIWETVKKCRSMSNTISKYLSDIEILMRHIQQKKELAEDQLEDACIEWIGRLPLDEFKKYAKEERMRLAMMANKNLRENLRHWKGMESDIVGFRKTLVMAMENIRGARKDILGSIGAAKLDNSWEPASLGRPVNLLGEAVEAEERL
jgi:hypothetical protein